MLHQKGAKKSPLLWALLSFQKITMSFKKLAKLVKNVPIWSPCFFHSVTLSWSQKTNYVNNFGLTKSMSKFIG
jgi:hypothetical protein